jgi:DNA polymerase (family 10)
MMTNQKISARFRLLADLMEIRGEEYFRIRSYRNAADIIESWPSDVQQIAQEEGLKGLQTIPGVGRAISAKIVELLETGTFEAWEKRASETPASVLDLLKVNGIGIKTAANLYQKFKISSLKDLRDFVEGGGLELVDGIGEKSAEKIQAEVARL